VAAYFLGEAGLGVAVAAADVGDDPQPQRTRPTKTATAADPRVANWQVMKVTRLPSSMHL